MGSHTAHLLASSPLTALLDKWSLELNTLLRRLPKSDVTVLLTSCHTELSEALIQARNTTLYITVDEAARLTNRCRSAITKLCRQHGANVGAKRIGGIWSIDKAKLQAYFTNEDALQRQ